MIRTGVVPSRGLPEPGLGQASAIRNRSIPALVSRDRRDGQLTVAPAAVFLNVARAGLRVEIP